MLDNEEESTLEELKTRARSYSKSDKMASGKKNSEFKDLEKISSCCPQATKWFDAFNRLIEAVNTMQREVKSLKTDGGKTISDTLKKSYDDKIKVLEGAQNQLTFKTNLLANIIIQHEEKIQEINNKVKTSLRRELRLNLIIEGILEDKNET